MREIVYTEKLNSIRNEMTHLWTSFFIVGGGSFTLLFNKPTFVLPFWHSLDCYLRAYFLMHT